MERMAPFKLHGARTLDEALALLRTPGARPIAGGTDLVPNLRHGLGAPTLLVDVTQIAGLDRIEATPVGFVLGANVTLARLARDLAISAALPALAQAAQGVAGPAHRSSATLGGNLCVDTRCIFYNQSAWWRQANNFCLKHGGDTCHVAPQGSRCHAAYAGDTAAALIALGAEVEIAGASRPRRMPLAALYVDDGAKPLALVAGELVVRVHVPAHAAGTRSAYHKARARSAIDFPLAGVAVRLRMDAARLADLAVALTGTNSRPLRLEGTEAFVGGPVDDDALAGLARLVAHQAGPMRTTTTAANWRRVAASVAMRRLVAALSAPG